VSACIEVPPQVTGNPKFNVHVEKPSVKNTASLYATDSTEKVFYPQEGKKMTFFHNAVRVSSNTRSQEKKICKLTR